MDYANLAMPALRSPSSDEDQIVTMKVPFIFSGSCSNKASYRDGLATCRDKRKQQPRSLYSKESHFATGGNDSRGIDGGGEGGDDKYVDVRLGSLHWAEVKEVLVLVEEMRAMAKARQGPILLMSTSTSLVRKLHMYTQYRKKKKFNCWANCPANVNYDGCH